MKKTLRSLAMVAATLTMLTTATGAALASTNGVQAHATAQAPQLAADGTIATPVPAGANTVSGTGNAPAAMGDCPDFNLCLWVNAGFPGTPWKADFFNEPHNTWLPVGASVNNAASSIWNFRDVSTEVAQFRDGTGLTACLPAGWWTTNLAGFNWPGSSTTMNDSITSYKFDTTSQC